MNVTVFGATGAIGSLTEHAVAGADAVVSALGPSMDRTATGLPLVESTEHITAAQVDDSTYLKAAPAISN